MKVKPLEKLLLYLVSILIHLISFPIFLELNLVSGVWFCFVFKVMVCMKEISLEGGTRNTREHYPPLMPSLSAMSCVP